MYDLPETLPNMVKNAEIDFNDTLTHLQFTANVRKATKTKASTAIYSSDICMACEILQEDTPNYSKAFAKVSTSHS